jgi:hypothetical protein
MRKIAIFLPLFICLGLASCDTHSEKKAEEAAREDSLRVADSTKRAHETQNVPENKNMEREKYRMRTERELDSLHNRIDTLELRMGKQGGKMKADWQKTKTDINTRSERIRMRLKQTGEKTDAEWQEFKAEVNRSMDSLRADWHRNVHKHEKK